MAKAVRHTSLVSDEYDVTAAGDRYTFEHGLTNFAGYPVTPTAVFFTAHAADADGAISTPPVIYLVSLDDTEAVIRCNVDATTFDALFVYDAAVEEMV